MTKDDRREVGEKLLQLAKGGDVPAIATLIEYSGGRLPFRLADDAAYRGPIPLIILPPDTRMV